MTEILLTTARVAVLLFLVSSMAGTGLGLTLWQVIGPLRNGRLVILAVVANFMIVPMLAVGIAANFKGALRIIGTGAVLAAILFAVLSALAGWLLAGRDVAQRTVLGLGTGLRNIPAALLVGVQNFKDPNVSVMMIGTTLTGILILLPAARLVGRPGPGALPGKDAIERH